jgi:hypothetical protein
MPAKAGIQKPLIIDTHAFTGVGIYMLEEKYGKCP